MLQHVLAPLKGYICLYYKPPSIPSCFVMTMLVWTCMQQLLIIEVISVIIEVISLSFFLRKTHYKAMYLRMRVLPPSIPSCFVSTMLVWTCIQQLFIIEAFISVGFFQGRPITRHAGNPHRQILPISVAVRDSPTVGCIACG